ncbi:hypothetical protein [Curtobacterium sp. C1]|nr:hypothetical protein [Curtobacterium sp. C1]
MTAGHGPRCHCDACWIARGIDPYDDDRDGKAIARAAEYSDD